jgi:hypothetical protein
MFSFSVIDFICRLVVSLASMTVHEASGARALDILIDFRA